MIRKFWYMDLTGSGIETTSHLHEPGNGRVTVMFNAFSGPPRILRIWGKGKPYSVRVTIRDQGPCHVHNTCWHKPDFCLAGTPLEYGTPRFNEIVASEGINIIPGTRSIVLVDIHQVGTSCSFSMPCYDFVSFRPTLNDFFEKRVNSEREEEKGRWD